jgi:hypothetical protein
MKYIRGCKITQFDTAQDFQEAYRICFRPNSSNNIVAIPGFANGFFACEIYLKILIGKQVKGHYLFELFSQLSDEDKESLRQKYVSIKQENLSFDDFLKVVDCGFIFWRYIYEDDNENEFKSNYPFLYSELFLQTYLPILESMAKKREKLTQN